jgi:hypothetical protein
MTAIKNFLMYLTIAAFLVGILWLAFSVWYAKYEICRGAGYNMVVCIGVANR